MASGVPTGLKALAQTLPVLQVPDSKFEEEEESGEVQYRGGVVNGKEELATVASKNAVTSVITEVFNMCLEFDNCTTDLPEPVADNCTMNCTVEDPIHTQRNYWTLLLLLFPVFTVFGNILVLMSVYKERSLQTVTNYFIVSLAVADLLLASIVMPFAVYYLVGHASVVGVEGSYTRRSYSRVAPRGSLRSVRSESYDTERHDEGGKARYRCQVVISVRKSL